MTALGVQRLGVQRLTYADYLALEAESGLRHEFWSGEDWAMTGGSMDHSLLKTAAVMLLGPALRAAGRPCRLLDSDAKLWLGASDMAVYPDLSVVCGPILRPPHDPNAAVNPVLVMEVLSPSAAHRDLGLKRAAYMRVPGLQHMLFVHAERVEVERWTRLTDGAWEVRSVGPGAQMPLPGLEPVPTTDPSIIIEIDALYANTELIEATHAQA